MQWYLDTPTIVSTNTMLLQHIHLNACCARPKALQTLNLFCPASKAFVSPNRITYFVNFIENATFPACTCKCLRLYIYTPAIVRCAKTKIQLRATSLFFDLLMQGCRQTPPSSSGAYGPTSTTLRKTSTRRSMWCPSNAVAHHIFFYIYNSYTK